MTTAALTTRPGLKGRILALMEARRARQSQMATYRQTLRELETLSARELADLGLSRFDIRRVAQEAAFGQAA